jgi:hypothetical protein
MKHLWIILFTLFLLSCNKQKDKSYTCTCNIHGAAYSTETKQITANNQSNADGQCRDYGASVANGAHFECSTQ